MGAIVLISVINRLSNRRDMPTLESSRPLYERVYRNCVALVLKERGLEEARHLSLPCPTNPYNTDRVAHCSLGKALRTIMRGLQSISVSQL